MRGRRFLDLILDVKFIPSQVLHVFQVWFNETRDVLEFIIAA